MTFERPHHRRIARVLEALDGERLRALQCWFGGGTAIALLHGEYRESLDIDFLVSDLGCYRQLRQSLAGAAGIDALLREGEAPIALERPVRADQYGIRTMLRVEGVPIKFEIVLEARIALQVPGRRDMVCGVSTLTAADLAASKFLANADRWRDRSVFCRDAIDLAMLDLPPRRLRPGLEKAAGAYGPAAANEMMAALDDLRDREGWLQRCVRALSVALPPARVQQQLRKLRRRLEAVTAPEA